MQSKYFWYLYRILLDQLNWTCLLSLCVTTHSLNMFISGNIMFKTYIRKQFRIFGEGLKHFGQFFSETMVKPPSNFSPIVYILDLFCKNYIVHTCFFGERLKESDSFLILRVPRIALSHLYHSLRMFPCICISTFAIRL